MWETLLLWLLMWWLVVVGEQVAKAAWLVGLIRWFASCCWCYCLLCVCSVVQKKGDRQESMKKNNRVCDAGGF